MTEAYLARLGLGEAPEPSLESLRTLHRAHLERIPYDNLSIMMGRPDPATSDACVERAGSGRRLGYCFQQNTALEALLVGLGYAVSRRHGHVWVRPEGRLDASLNHLVLVVSGLPTDDNPGGHWWVDAGLGDGFAEPLALVRGEQRVDGFRYEIGAGYGAQAAGRPRGPAAWTFDHDPSGAFTGVVVTERPSDPAAVEAAHRALSTAADSPFRSKLVVQRHDGDAALTLRGCLLTEQTATVRTETELSSYDAWREALVDRMLLPVGTDEDLVDLWERTRVAHAAWTAAGRP
ncbi:arylamine N-acetyltransferase family protein [Nocardioides sp. P5_C9_2]